MRPVNVSESEGDRICADVLALCREIQREAKGRRRPGFTTTNPLESTGIRVSPADVPYVMEKA